MITPDVARLGAALTALASWQDDDAPLQLHPGDVGWAWRFGAEKTAAAVRLWDDDALGFLDEPDVLRLALARHDDHELARRVADDLPQVLPGRGQVEVPPGALRSLLQERGWSPHDPWTQLQHDLDPVAPQPLRRWHEMAAGPAYQEARCLLGRDSSGVAVAAATCGRRARGARDCSSRSACTPSTNAGALRPTAPRASGCWGRPAT